jgi:hypothetical protein
MKFIRIPGSKKIENIFQKKICSSSQSAFSLLNDDTFYFSFIFFKDYFFKAFVCWNKIKILDLLRVCCHKNNLARKQYYFMFRIIQIIYSLLCIHFFFKIYTDQDPIKPCCTTFRILRGHVVPYAHTSSKFDSFQGTLKRTYLRSFLNKTASAIFFLIGECSKTSNQ